MHIALAQLLELKYDWGSGKVINKYNFSGGFNYVKIINCTFILKVLDQTLEIWFFLLFNNLWCSSSSIIYVQLIWNIFVF